MKIMKRKIGLYSGTFDPIHEGHIAFAREALKACHLDKVIFLPEALPRAKQHVSSITSRVADAQKALGQSPFYKIHKSRYKQFSTDVLLPEMMELYPDARFVILIGSDVALHLSKWSKLDVLAQSAQFAIGLRKGQTKHDVVSTLDATSRLLTHPLRYTIVTTDQAHISSSQKRAASV